MTARIFLALMAALCCWSVGAQGYSTKPQSSAPRYTFSWPLDENEVKPRGGTTKGAPVTLDTSESPAWKALQERNLSSFERDRRAILAMSGTYRVTFDFLEIAPFTVSDKANAPYQSWGTEKIYVARDGGRFISLVHILEMRVVQKDGTLSEPMVTKHWRQDWTFEPTHLVEYQGRDLWHRRKLAGTDAKGAWSQTVYQVDESPRYASIGRWQHSASFSSWLSADTWRPLPRREWGVRDDYQTLIGTNRHTITPVGWLQEENNLKAVLSEDRRLDASRPYVGREYGVARYERIVGNDFAGADRYYAGTKVFWDEVRDRWNEVFTTKGRVELRGPVDKLGLFQPLFAHADEILEQGATASARNDEVIESSLQAMGAL